MTILVDYCMVVSYFPALVMWWERDVKGTPPFCTAIRPFNQISYYYGVVSDHRRVLPYTYRKRLEMLLNLIRVCFNGAFASMVPLLQWCLCFNGAFASMMPLLQ